MSIQMFDDNPKKVIQEKSLIFNANIIKWRQIGAHNHFCLTLLRYFQFTYKFFFFCYQFHDAREIIE